MYVKASVVLTNMMFTVFNDILMCSKEKSVRKGITAHMTMKYDYIMKIDLAKADISGIH